MKVYYFASIFLLIIIITGCGGIVPEIEENNVIIIKS
jgi:hypothetical protein